MKTRKFVSVIMLISLIMIAMLPVQTALAADTIPYVVNGRTLLTSMTGDNSEWIEIARYNDYSLIIRKNVTGQTSFGTSNTYNGSTARNSVNNWFRSTLSSSARLRDFTVKNDATTFQKLGSLYSINENSPDISIPYAEKARTGDDVAFLLNFEEAALFCSTQYAKSFSVYIQSSNVAAGNFNKLTAISGTQPANHWWLRSNADPNKFCTVGLGGSNTWGIAAMNGAVNQYDRSSTVINIRPALWVGSGIFHYTLTYDANGGEGAPPPQSGDPGAVLTISSTVPARQGYNFQGWAASPTAASPQYRGGDTIVLTGDITLFAVWSSTPVTPTYTLSYNANGGTGAPPPQTGIPADTNAIISSTTPSHPDHSFTGWSTDSNSSVALYQPGDNIFMNSDKTLYAVWDGTTAHISNTVITKLLQMPYGTIVPTTTFTFKVTPVSVDSDVTVIAPVAGIGQNGIVTISFPSSNYTKVETIGDTVSYYLESDDLFGNVDWPYAGIYEYEIEEICDPHPGIDPNHTMTCSKAKYSVIVYVSNDDADNNGILDVIHISVFMTEDDAGSTIDANNQEKGKLTFKNKFVKNNGGIVITDPDDWTLAISKKVTGTFSNKSVYFDFILTVTAPSLVPNPPAPTYNAYIVQKNSAGVFSVVTNLSDNNATASGTDADGNPYITFTSGAAVTFSLRDSQYLVFMDTPVGTSYTVKEFGTTYYTPGVTVVYDKLTSQTDSTKYGLGDSLELPNSAIGSIMLFVSEDGSSANFTNNRDEVPSTGLSFNELHFIVIIALTLGTLVAYITVKTQKSKYFNQM